MSKKKMRMKMKMMKMKMVHHRAIEQRRRRGFPTFGSVDLFAFGKRRTKPVLVVARNDPSLNAYTAVHSVQERTSSVYVVEDRWCQ